MVPTIKYVKLLYNAYIWNRLQRMNKNIPNEVYVRHKIKDEASLI